MEGKPGILGEHKNVTIVDIGCFEDSEHHGIYAFCLDGHLLMFNKEAVLEKWLHTKMERGSCMIVKESLIFCGGSDGKIRLFKTGNLSHVANIHASEHMYATYPTSKEYV